MDKKRVIPISQLRSVSQGVIRWPTGANELQWPTTFPLGETRCSFKNNANTKTQMCQNTLKCINIFTNLTTHTQHLLKALP